MSVASSSDRHGFARVLSAYLFFGWPDPPGRALRFFAPASGAGVSRGLLVLGLAPFGPKTLLMARSAAAPPFEVFSTFLRLAGGLPLTAAAFEIPSPTVAGESAFGGFRDLAPPAFLLDSPFCLPSWSSKSDS